MAPKKDKEDKKKGKRVFTPEQREHRRKYQAWYREKMGALPEWRAAEVIRTSVCI